MCLLIGVGVMCGNTLKVCYDEPDFSSSAKILQLKESYKPQTNGEISHSIMQNWTKQAIECYEIKSDCSSCSLNAGNYSFECQMPKIIKALLKAYGPPLNNEEFF